MYYRNFLVILSAIILIFFNSQSYAYDKEKFGVYEDLQLQGIFSTKIGNTDPYRTAATEIQFRFLNKKSTLDKYPAKAIEGLIWFEIFYNESIKNEQSVIEDDIIDLWEIRKGIRESELEPCSSNIYTDETDQIINEKNKDLLDIYKKRLDFISDWNVSLNSVN